MDPQSASSLPAPDSGPPTLRIFISSPGDVADEREKARQVIAQLQDWYGDLVQLLPVLWEELPLELDFSFQQGIDAIVGENSIDIAVFILWSRLGSPLGKSVLDREGKPYRSGTEREFDLMLAALDKSGGKRPDILFYYRDDEAGFTRNLSDHGDAATLEEIVCQRKLAQAFVQEHFQDEEGHNTRAYHRFHQPVEFASRLKVHLRSLIDQRSEAGEGQRKARWTEAPYRGLEVFDLQHADIFFGREAEVCELETRLRQREREGCAFVAVVGASGSGKSSLVRAGLQASLTRFSLDESVREWRSTVLLPSQTEGQPLRGLVRALIAGDRALPELAQSGLSETEIAEALAEAPSIAVRTVFKPALVHCESSVLPVSSEAEDPAERRIHVHTKLLLVIDQFEELFTDKQISPLDRDRFLLALEAFAKIGLGWVVVTLRSDFYQVAQTNEVFLRLKGERGHYDLLAPGPEALQRIITEPARMAGLGFERRSPELGGRRLVGKILEDAKGQPDMLPLLSDLLLELYQLRSPENVLTFAAYESLGDEQRTGLEGALSKRAEKEFSRLTPEQQATCPEILHALVTVEADTDVRRRANLAGLRDTPEKAALVDAFIQARLLTADGPTVSLAHEALLRKWDRVVDWIRNNRQFLLIRSRVEQALKRWSDAGKRPDLLLPEGLDLEEGVSLLEDAPHLLAGNEYQPVREFIAASQGHHEARRHRARAVRRTVTFFLSLLALATTAGAIFGYVQTKEAERERDEAFYRDGLASLLRAQVARQDGNRFPDRFFHLGRAIGFSGFGRVEPESQDSFLGRVQTVLGLGGVPEKWPVLITKERDRDLHLSIRRQISSLPAYLPLWSSELRHDAAATALAVDPTGNWLALGTKSGVRLFDVAAGTETTLQGVTGVTDLDFDPAGKMLAIAAAEGVRIWDVAKNALGFSPQGKSTSLAWSPTGNLLAGAATDGTILLWKDAGGSRTDIPVRPESASPHGTGKNAHPTDRIEAALKKPVTSLVFSAKDSFLAGLEPGAGPRVFFPDLRVAVSAWLDLNAERAETLDERERPEFLSRVALAATASAIAIDPDGRLLATGTTDGNVVLWDAERMAVTAQVSPEQRHQKRVTAVAYRPDGKQLASASDDGTVKLWEVRGSTVAIVATLNGHTGAATAISYAPSGQILASAGADGSAKLWDVSGTSLASPDLLSYLRERWYVFNPDSCWDSGSGFANLDLAQLAGRWRATETRDLVAEAVAAAKEQRWRRVKLLADQGAILSADVQAGIAAALPARSPKLKDAFTNGIGMILLWCPPGTFVMGSPENEAGRRNNEDQHRVTLTAGFWLGNYECTQAEWVAVMGRNPAAFKEDLRNPVEQVSSEDVKEFCRRLTDLERVRGTLLPGWTYDLPTEAQWEYACRAGTTTAWSFGDDPAELCKYGNYADSSSYAEWKDQEHDDNYKLIAPVGRYFANPWGFHDMHGNVSEWCRDPYFERLGTKSTSDPKVPPFGYNGVLRGGGWDYLPVKCRSAMRITGRLSRRLHDNGFRVAMVPIPASEGMMPSTGFVDAPERWKNTINLLPLIDITQDTVAGTWTMQPDGLLSDRNPGACLELPYEPPEEYDFRITFTRVNGGEGIHQILFKAGHSFEWVMGAQDSSTVGFMSLEGQIFDNRSMVFKPGCIVSGRRHTSTVSVRNGAVAGYLDGELIKEWKTDYHEMTGPYPAFKLAHKRQLGIGSFAASTAFHSIEVLEISGKGKMTRLEGLAVKLPGQGAGTIGAAQPGSAGGAPRDAALAAATQDKPFVNSLGMKFVPVPGTKVLFCIHETRYRDYEAYAKENPGVDPPWKNQTHDNFRPTDRPEDHPVTQVSWDEAAAFCAWLSEKEGKTCRLPTDHEWSVAVGIGDREDPNASPAVKYIKVPGYPWGSEFPPPKGTGNFCDESRKAKAPRADAQYLENYDDGFPTAAPVMSFRANQFGIYDLDGNVREWVQDWWDKTQKNRVLRGGSWHADQTKPASEILLSSYRKSSFKFPDRNFHEGLPLCDGGWEWRLAPGRHVPDS